MALLNSKEPSYNDARHNRHGARIAVGAALGALAYGYHRLEAATREDKANTNLDMEVAEYHSEDGEFAIFIDTGLFQDPHRVLASVLDSFKDLGSIYAMRHGPDVEQNRQTMLKLMEHEAGKRFITFSMSKGGLDRQRLKEDPEYVERSPFVEVEAYDSAVFLRRQMTFKGIAMTIAGRALPKNHVSEVLFRQRNIQRDKKLESDGRTSVRDTSELAFYIAQESAKTLMTHKYASGENRAKHTQQKVGKVIMIAAEKDRLVNTKKSAAWLANEVGTEVLYATDTRQPAGYHTGLPSYPAFYRETLEKIVGGEEIALRSPENPDSPYSLLTPQEPVY